MSIRFYFSFTLISALTCSALVSRPAPAFETMAKSAILVEMSTGETLMAKDADALMPPASMSKLMTLYYLFERIKDGSVSLEDKFAVSENAWRRGGYKSGSSRMFLKPKQRVRVEDLIRGIAIQSGNDACIVVAEGLSGSEAAFAAEMTARAREIGLTKSTFANSTGWPHPDHRMTPRDLATLSRRLITDFPEYYHYFSEMKFSYNNIDQPNRNPLLYKEMNADGLKTGHTQESGYGLTASAKRGERRLILVVNGLPSKKTRSQEPERILNWGFREFNNYALFKAGEMVDEAVVWLGKSARVPMLINRDVVLTLPRKVRRKMKVKLVYEGPVAAPIKKGAPIANLVITVPGRDTMTLPLVAGADVAQLGTIGRLWAALKTIIFGENG